jgi:hypothetical protein
MYHSKMEVNNKTHRLAGTTASFNMDLRNCPVHHCSYDHKSVDLHFSILKAFFLGNCATNPKCYVMPTPSLNYYHINI